MTPTSSSHFVYVLLTFLYATWVQAFDDAFALQRALQAFFEMDDLSVSKRHSGTLMASAAELQRCVAFYAQGRLQASLESLLPAAAAATEAGQHGSEGEEVLGEQEGRLFAVLQEQAGLLSAPQVAELAQQLGSQQPTSGQPQAPGPPPALQALDAAAAQGQLSVQQQLKQQLQEQQQQEQRQQQPEAQPQPRLVPGWWLSLPVVHVPRLLYEDGGEGLMMVSIQVAAAPGSSHLRSPGASGSNGSQPRGVARHLVAFADQADAQALALLTMRSAQGAEAVQVQTLCLAPSQLRAHAATHGCDVTVLLPQEVLLPAGGAFEDVVESVHAAVQNQYFRIITSEFQQED